LTSATYKTTIKGLTTKRNKWSIILLHALQTITYVNRTDKKQRSSWKWQGHHLHYHRLQCTQPLATRSKRRQRIN